MHMAYVAGIVDGEGCLGFTKSRSGIIPRLMVTNTNFELLNALKEQSNWLNKKGNDRTAHSPMLLEYASDI